MRDDDFLFEDTDPEGGALRKKRDESRLTLTSFVRDLLGLAILAGVLYFLYFSGYTYYRYNFIKDKVTNAAILASKTTDNPKVKGYLSSFCMADKEFFCRPENIKIDRNFDYASVSMKFKYKFKILGKYPVILTFKPKVKYPIE